jgi:transposase
MNQGRTISQGRRPTPQAAATRQNFTAEFKRDAVELSLRPGMTVQRAATDLGIPSKYLYRWRYAFKHYGAAAFPGHGQLRPAEEEVVRLRRENAELKMEREILKKATTWFAKQL